MILLNLMALLLYCDLVLIDTNKTMMYFIFKLSQRLFDYKLKHLLFKAKLITTFIGLSIVLAIYASKLMVFNVRLYS